MKAIWNDTLLAESDKTIVVEGIHYFPPDSINRQYLKESDRRTTCLWKGEAYYYTIEAGGGMHEDGAWYYPDPKQEARPIKDYVAFSGDVGIVK
ncbi:MAG: DUF427 domain-containing protein [Deltaproteobacteria bacterium]|nr:DUF427 domain-containing protein [Candidatus Zymogenaceae bacterium]